MKKSEGCGCISIHGSPTPKITYTKPRANETWDEYREKLKKRKAVIHKSKHFTHKSQLD